MLHRKHKYDIIIILSVVALCVSIYLSLAKAMSLTVPCDFTGGCETVLNSKYASFAGVPLSTWGIAYFSTVLVLCLLANHYKKIHRLLTLVLGAGALGALGFLSIQFFILKSVCQYCLLTDSIGILIFLWDLNIEHHNPNLAS